MRDIGVYLGLTPKRYQSGETDVGLGISHQGDAMARHYLFGPLRFNNFRPPALERRRL
jgi:transposase